MNVHRPSGKKETKKYSKYIFINRIILWMTQECKTLKRFAKVRKIQPSSLHLSEQVNCSRSRTSAQLNHGFNDQTKGIGTLSCISCKKTNIYSLFNKQPRRKRSHGSTRTTVEELVSQMLVWYENSCRLVNMIEKP